MFNLIVSTATMIISAIVIPHLPDDWFIIGLVVVAGCGLQFGNNLGIFLSKSK